MTKNALLMYVFMYITEIIQKRNICTIETMKNPWNSKNENIMSHLWEKERLVPIPGFDGYYVTRFNDIVSFNSSCGNIISTFMKVQGKYESECVQLYDDTGRRRLRSKVKLLKGSMPLEEYERRCVDAANQAVIVAREEEERVEAILKEHRRSAREHAMAHDLGDMY